MTVTRYGYVSSVFFALIGAGHLLRVLGRWPVTIGTQVVPMWPSVIALVVTAYLAWEGCRVARRLV